MRAAKLKERPGFSLMKQTDIQDLYYMQMPRWLFSDPRYADMSHPLCVLDLCASPGGKSTHLRSLLTDDSLLISNEIVRTRAQILAENMMR